VSYVADSEIFENHFGFHQRLDLTSTFRLNDRLEDVTSTFIMKNESQGRKHLQTDPEKEATIPSVRVLMVEDSKGLADYRSGVERALALILEQESPVPPSVLVLDRYEKRYASQPSPEVALGIRDFMCAHRGVMQASFSTIHGSKGLECDFVILVGLENNLSRLSFPSCFSDDPILDTLLARPESFPDAEERRLFYVATTRAKEAVYLVAPRRYPSVFIRELDEDGSDVEWLDKLDSHTLPRCNECCSVGVVRLWQGVKWEGKQLHNFWKCNLCRARPKEVRCPCCAKGMVVLLNGLQPPYAKKCPSCGHVIPAEPERRSGFKPEHHEQPALDL